MSSDLAFALRGVGTAVGGGFALRDVSFELPTGYVRGSPGDRWVSERDAGVRSGSEAAPGRPGDGRRGIR